MNLAGNETIPCRICSKPTPMLGTKLCDGCYELESRIRHQPELARRILAELEKPMIAPRMVKL